MSVSLEEFNALEAQHVKTVGQLNIRCGKAETRLAATEHKLEESEKRAQEAMRDLYLVLRFGINPEHKDHVLFVPEKDVLAEPVPEEFFISKEPVCTEGVVLGHEYQAYTQEEYDDIGSVYEYD